MGGRIGCGSGAAGDRGPPAGVVAAAGVLCSSSSSNNKSNRMMPLFLHAVVCSLYYYCSASPHERRRVCAIIEETGGFHTLHPLQQRGRQGAAEEAPACESCSRPGLGVPLLLIPPTSHCSGGGADLGIHPREIISRWCRFPFYAHAEGLPLPPPPPSLLLLELLVAPAPSIRCGHVHAHADSCPTVHTDSWRAGPTGRVGEADS